MKSSVEWYFEQVNILDYRYAGKVITLDEYVKEKFIIKEQSKNMEKQFIIDAFMAGAEIGEMHNNENRKFYIDAKEYYKNTY